MRVYSGEQSVKLPKNDNVSTEASENSQIIEKIRRKKNQKKLSVEAFLSRRRAGHLLRTISISSVDRINYD